MSGSGGPTCKEGGFRLRCCLGPFFGEDEVRLLINIVSASPFGGALFQRGGFQYPAQERMRR